MPLWAAAAVPVAAYLLRSVLRGLDFTPDLPADAVAFSVLGLLILGVAIARRSSTSYDRSDDLTCEVDHEDTPSDHEG